MARHGVQWATYATEQYLTLSTRVQKAVDRRLELLAEAPESNASYDAKADLWSSAFEFGWILFALHREVLKITVLRLSAPAD